MKIKILLLFTAICLSFGIANAQCPDRQPADGVIYGTILEKDSNEPVEFANIVVYDKNGNVIAGSMSDSHGKFSVQSVPYGTHKVEVLFIGYGKVTREGISITADKKSFNMGKIHLSVDAQMLGEVEVEATMNNVDYRLDRKVINVNQDIVSSGASAVEVLENAPSVTTDLDGNVSLRGSESFLVLIDGRPSPLEGSEALQQIPASSIESIEIITNPSAKYAPDGVGGIINVVLKKEKRKGYNGQVSANYGNNNTFGGSALFNFRTQKLNFFVGGEYNRRMSKSYGKSERETYLNPDKDSMFCLNNQNSGLYGRQSWNARAGLDIYITDNDVITISGKYGSRGHGGNGITEAETFYFNKLDSLIYDPHTYMLGDPYSYYTDEISKRRNNYWSGDINYQRKFAKPGHELQLYFNYSANRSNNYNEYTEAETQSLGGEVIDGAIQDRYNTVEIGTQDRYQAKADYVLPFNEKSKLEAGYEINIRNQTNDYKYAIWQSNDWVNDESRHSPYDFDLNVQSGYVIYSNFWKNFGYQVGLRTEYTNRLFAIPTGDYAYKKFDFFPSVHLSYSFSEDLQLMGSYSRRLERPRPWNLNPMTQVEDPNNIRRGNPVLNPEYTNSYDMSLQKRFGEHFVSFELYARQTNDLIQNVTLVDTANSNMYIKTFDNIGKDLSLGSEIMGNFNPCKWYNLNASVNAYYYSIKSQTYRSNSTFTWRVRINNTFRIKKSGTNIQFGGFYDAPSITAQGRSAGRIAFNLGIKQDFLDKRLSISVNFRNLFNTMKFNTTTETDYLYYHMTRSNTWPNFNISITYKLNDFKKRKEKGEDSDDDGGDM